MSVVVMLARPQPNAENCSKAELEIAMKAAASARSRDRMRAVRALILGETWESVMRIFEICEKTLERWVQRFNTSGIDGLVDKPRSGRPPAIPEEKAAECLELIREPAKADQSHWTARKFHGHLRTELGLEVAYSTTVRWLHAKNYRLKVPQPWPDRQDEALRQAHVEQVALWLADENVELWYTDETGVEGDPRPRRRWAEIGKTTRVTRNGDHLRMNIAGMISPRTGECFALQMSHSDKECFQAFLDEANRSISLTRKRNLLIMDNASWHKCKDLDWGRFEPVYLPPYSPDLNPIERLWLVLKANWFYDFIAKDIGQLMDRIDKALLWAFDRTSENQATCTIRTKL